MSLTLATVAIVDEMLVLGIHPSIGHTTVLKDSAFSVLGDGPQLRLFDGCSFKLSITDGEYGIETETYPDLPLSEDELEALAEELFADVVLMWDMKDEKVRH